MRGTYEIRMAALALATAAALPALAFAGEGNNRPQEQARIEQWIEQAIQGDAAGSMIQPKPAVRPAAMSQAGHVPLPASSIPGR